MSDQTFYRWKKKDGGLGVAEVRRLKNLEEENRRLKQLVADPRLDKVMLQDALQRKLKGRPIIAVWPHDCKKRSASVNVGRRR